MFAVCLFFLQRFWGCPSQPRRAFLPQHRAPEGNSGLEKKPRSGSRAPSAPLCPEPRRAEPGRAGRRLPGGVAPPRSLPGEAEAPRPAAAWPCPALKPSRGRGGEAARCQEDASGFRGLRGEGPGGRRSWDSGTAQRPPRRQRTTPGDAKRRRRRRRQAAGLRGEGGEAAAGGDPKRPRETPGEKARRSPGRP